MLSSRISSTIGGLVVAREILFQGPEFTRTILTHHVTHLALARLTSDHVLGHSNPSSRHQRNLSRTTVFARTLADPSQNTKGSPSQWPPSSPSLVYVSPRLNGWRFATQNWAGGTGPEESFFRELTIEDRCSDDTSSWISESLSVRGKLWNLRFRGWFWGYREFGGG